MIFEGGHGGPGRAAPTVPKGHESTFENMSQYAEAERGEGISVQ